MISFWDLISRYTQEDYIQKYTISYLSDRNECAGANKCHMYSNCLNTDGSYKCECRNGYSGDGEQCQGGHRCYCYVSLQEPMIFHNVLKNPLIYILVWRHTLKYRMIRGNKNN